MRITRTKYRKSRSSVSAVLKYLRKTVMALMKGSAGLLYTRQIELMPRCLYGIKYLIRYKTGQTALLQTKRDSLRHIAGGCPALFLG